MAGILANLVLDLDFTKGTAKDFSPKNNHGSLVGAEPFVKAPNGNAILPSKNGASVSVTDHASLDLDAFTLVFYCFFEGGLSSLGYLFDRDDGLANSLSLYVSAADTLALKDDTVTRTLAVTAADIRGKKTIIVTKGAGAATAKCYIDGVLHGSFSGTNEITTNINDLYIGAKYDNTGNFYYPIYSAMIYSDEKSAGDVLIIHNDVSARRTSYQSRHSFRNLEKQSFFPTGSFWNMDISDLTDKGANSNDGAIVGSVGKGATRWGETAIEFTASSTTDGRGYLNFGNDPSLNFTTQSFGGWLWWRELSATSTVFMSRGVPNSRGYYFQTNAGVLLFATNQLGASQLVISDPLLTNTWQLIGFFSESGAENRAYINGVQSGTTPTRIDPTTSTDNFTVGRLSAAAAGFAAGRMARMHIGSYASRSLFEAAMQEELEREGRNLIYREDFASAHVLRSTVSATDLAIPETEFFTDSAVGGIQIIDGNKKGEKFLQGTGANSAAITQHDGHPYGTWVIGFKHVAGENNIVSLYSDTPSLSASNRLQINMTGGANARIEASEDGASRLVTAVSSVSVGDHVLKVVLKPYGANNCTVYLDGAAVTAATGSNPFTVTITPSEHKYYVFSPSNLSNIQYIRHYFGDA